MMEASKLIFPYIVAGSVFLGFALGPELAMYPSFHKTLSYLTNLQIDFLGAMALAFIILLVLPMATITIFLSGFKKYTFGSYKNISDSYTLATTLLIAAYILNIFFMLVDTLSKFAFNSTAYMLLRSLIPFDNHPYRYHLTLSVINSMIFQTFTFLMCFAIAEMTIAYVKATSRQNLLYFMNINLRYIVFLISVLLFYIGLFIYLERAFSVKNIMLIRAEEPTFHRLDMGILTGMFFGSLYGHSIIS